MSEPTLPHRMEDYFSRQIAWMQELLADFDTLDAELDAEDFKSMVTRQKESARKTSDLEQEFRALWKEWESKISTVPESEQAPVRELAQRAEALSLRLAELSEQAAARVDQELTTVRSALLEVRRSRENLRKYAQQFSPPPGFMDKRA